MVAKAKKLKKPEDTGEDGFVTFEPLVKMKDWKKVEKESKPRIGFIPVASGSVTRPADTTPYTSGDMLANSTTAGSVTPLTLTISRSVAWSGLIRRIRLRKSTTSVTNASFRVHLWTTAPTTTTGDNAGPFAANNIANYLGYVDVTVDKALSDGAMGVGLPADGSEVMFALPATGQLRALIEVRGAYTPGNAEVFTVTPEILENA